MIIECFDFRHSKKISILWPGEYRISLPSQMLRRNNKHGNKVLTLNHGPFHLSLVLDGWFPWLDHCPSFFVNFVCASMSCYSASMIDWFDTQICLLKTWADDSIALLAKNWLVILVLSCFIDKARHIIEQIYTTLHFAERFMDALNFVRTAGLFVALF